MNGWFYRWGICIPYSFRRKTTCRLGLHKFVEFATYDGPLEWNPYMRAVYPARRTYWACISCLKPQDGDGE